MAFIALRKVARATPHLRKFLKQSRRSDSSKVASCHWSRLIRESTEVSTDHLTPEIPLHLITPNCAIWHGGADESPVVDPFWGFYWPGGQALTRFVLDNPEVVRGKRVLDIGSGCGATSIACMMSGAAHVTANDIDPVAIEALHLNCALNSVSVATSTADHIGQETDKLLDVILFGDVLYAEEFTDRIGAWIPYLITEGKSVFIGDPGRLFLENHPMKNRLRTVFEVDLPSVALQENCGFLHGYVWEVVR